MSIRTYCILSGSCLFLALPLGGADKIETKTTYAKAYGATKGNPAVDPAKDLPRYPAVEPKDAVATWQIKKGFKLELAAHEPQVRSPIAISFDERGRMFVCEMIDYSEMRDVTPHLGRISMLEDRDGDGYFETSTVFADDLAWPTGLICANGGVYVIATPDVWFFKDTKGAGRADVREKVFTGFGTGLKILNVQGLANCPQWGQDNRIHIQAGGGNRGIVRRVGVPPATSAPGILPGSAGKMPTAQASGKMPELQEVELGGRDFWFDPRTHEFGLEAGGAQFGMSFDNCGRKFACSNSDHLQFFAYDDRYAARNPYFTMPPARQSIAADGGAAEVFRISPDEPWRIVRTRWRIAGVVKGSVEGGGRVSGYFTGATGTTVYRGDAYGADFVNNTFTGDAGGQLVHRKKIHPDGVSLVGRRPDDEQTFEFAASKDTWVRVVNFANAPDGCLYVIDMYREVIEHPWSIPDEIKKHVDLNNGNDRGRIYRIVPDRADWKRRTGVDLSKASTAELVQSLEHPNGWQRDTAQRLLYERQDKAAVPLLEKLISSSLTLPSRVTDQTTGSAATKPASNTPDSGESGYNALAKLHALGALDGLGGLSKSVVHASLRDSDPRVRERGVLLCENLLHAGGSNDELLDELSGFWKESDPRVRLQLAFTLGEFHAPRLMEVDGGIVHETHGDLTMALLHNSESEPLIRAAVFSGCKGRTAFVFNWLSFRNKAENIEDQKALLESIRMIGFANKKDEVASVIAFITRSSSQSASLRALAEGLRRAGTTIAQVDTDKKLAPGFAKAANTARDANATDATRIDAINLVTLDTPQQAVPALVACLDKTQSAPVQSAAVSALGHFSGNEVTDALIEGWPGLQKKARTAAFAVLLARPERATALLHAIESKKIATGDLTASDVQSLFKHKDNAVAARADKILAELKPPSRESVIAKFQPALATRGDAARGQVVFNQRCMACHKAGNLGVDVAPPLLTVKTKGREGIFAAILDPNKEVAPQYIAYTVNTKDGQTLGGIITNDSANSMTLKMMGGAEVNIPRSNIKGSSAAGLSLMPEGIEAGMSVQEMADLLDFIESLK